jgi:hypothetical protein
MRFTKIIRAKSAILRGVELFLGNCEGCGEEAYREKGQRFCAVCQKKKQRKRA